MKDKLHISLLSKEKSKETSGYFAHLLPQDMTDAMSSWEFVCAFYEGRPCGILAYIIGDEITLPWIYVDKDYRRRSIGSRMIEALRIELEDKLLFTGFSCEIIINPEGAGAELVDFFASLDDIDIMPKYCMYEVSPDMYRKAFAEHSMFKGNQNFPAQRLTDLPEYRKRAFMNNPKVADTYQIDQPKKWGEAIEKDLSLCIIEDDEVASAILVSDMGEDRMSIELIYADGTKSMLKLLVAFGNALINKDNGKSLVFRPVDEKILRLAEEFFPDIMVYGEVWEASTF